jgi:hypothetical protein
MDPWVETGQDILVFALLLCLNVYLCLLLSYSLGRSLTGLPRPLSRLVERWTQEDLKVNTFSIVAGVAMLCFFQVPGLVSLWPWGNLSPVERICALAFLLAEGLWFRYMRKHLGPASS